MNKTAELILNWVEYEQNHPECTLEEFYRFMLLNIGMKEKKDEGFLGGSVPPKNTSILGKLLGRLSHLNYNYIISGLKEIGINNIDDFTYLNTIQHHKMPKKTDVIQQNFSELSSGLLIIERLKKSGFICEQPDEEDKRSKRLYITDFGEKKLHDCFKKLSQACEMFYGELSDDEIKLCIQILMPLELKFSKLWHQHKNQSFEQNMEEILTQRRSLPTND